MSSGIATKRTGSTVFTVLPFFICPALCYASRQSDLNGGFMTQHQRVRQQLLLLEAQMREHNLWQTTAPAPNAFVSTQPFCMDTLEPFEWLQWVLIPRMHALLDSQQALPQAFAIAPYYEIALDAANPSREAMLVHLQQLDALFSGENA